MPSRRTFLTQLGGLLAAPVLLSGCGRPTTVTAQSDAPVDETNLDEIDNAASFRPAIPKSEPVIRVRVVRVREEDAAIHIGTEGQWIRLHRDQSPGHGVALSAPVVVSMLVDHRSRASAPASASSQPARGAGPAGSWSIVDGKGFRAATEARETIDLLLMDAAVSDLLSIHETADNSPRQYPGSIRLVSRHDLWKASPGAFDVVNDVPLESYLPGVLAGELYPSWPLQTFAAQAVAARSFAATEAAVFADRRHYDVSNTASSQMYVGGVTLKPALDGVAQTRGLMLGYDGLLVSGYYSSCCGGVAAAAIDAIGANPVNDIQPLNGRNGQDVCTSAPVYQWKIQQSLDLLGRRLAAFAQEKRLADVQALVRLSDIEVAASNAHGRPTHLTLIDSRGKTAKISAENFRRAANYSGQGLNAPDKPLKSSNFKSTISGGQINFEGFGYGHGVGLCQYGAEALARSGMAHADILNWYYPSADLVQAYG